MSTETKQLADEIPKRFDFENVETRIFEFWTSGGYFSAAPSADRKPFTIVIPPPNVTGALHLGHALNNTLQDIMTRMKRMQGYEALWMPGTDHAGIATQARVEKRLKENEGKTRHDLGRSALVDRIWAWKDEYETRIIGQLKQLGASCDWERTRFTLDEMCAKAVRFTFFDLFQKQLIYRAKRLVNWDTHLGTTVSNDEVENVKKQGQFWHFMYPVIDPQSGEPAHVLVATTRPETMLGDTAVAVHPDPAAAFKRIESEFREKLKKASKSDTDDIQAELDELIDRRTKMLPKLEQLRDMAKDGRKLKLPLMDREIPIVCDIWAKPELGSGCVKITPAHDPNDYLVAQRCGLPMINIMNPDGTLNAETGSYEGLTMKKARNTVVQDLEALGLLERVEDREIEMPISDRSKTPIEPFLTDQWFVAMEQLSQSAMDAVTDGRVKIYPKRYENGYLDWLGEKRDWPVSRQLWWGHQIPVWSLGCESEAEVNDTIEQVKSHPDFSDSISSIQVESCPEKDETKRIRLGLPFATIHVCLQIENEALEKALTQKNFVRDPDVLDTWFSSALWPHSTLGWPEKTKELDYFYPTSTLITSRDIISLWVARMVLMGLNNCDEVPFHEVYIHPKIQDGFGETMSKSRGNGIDPLDVIAKFGADALRFGMARLCTETQDVRLPVQFECPRCGHSFDQTRKNRELPKINCPSCNEFISTQWAETKEDKSLPRASALSERFEVSRNFVNKLWNASRFAMLNLDGYQASPIDEQELTIEDRWMLSRLAGVSQQVTDLLSRYKYSETASILYDFAWDEFCSFFVEILKERFSNPQTRPHAQRMLAFTLDNLLRLLHPMMPFITEEIWLILGRICPERGFLNVKPASPALIVAQWPDLDQKWCDVEIENQFSLFQSALSAIREIRSKQNIEFKREIQFQIECDPTVEKTLAPMAAYFHGMVNAKLMTIGQISQRPNINATVSRKDFDIVVDLDGLIDKEAEKTRLSKEKESLEKSITSKQRQLSNERFVAAKPDLAEKVQLSLEEAKAQLEKVLSALKRLS